MKKLYLSFVAAATLFGANTVVAEEPALKAVWSKVTDWPGDSWGGATVSIDWNASDNMMGENTGTRWGVGVNGKIYAVNDRTMSIMAFDENGYKDVYKLPSLAGKTITYNNLNAELSTNTIPDFYGTLISRDDAGHFIVGHGFTTGAMPCTWTVFDPATGNGKTFYKDDFGFADAPAGSFLRIDAVGRTLGDVLDYGIMWVAPTSIYWRYNNNKALCDDFSWATGNNVQRTKIIEFSGNGDVNDVTATGKVTSLVNLDAHIVNICQPSYKTIDEYYANEDSKGKMEALTEGAFLYSKLEKVPLVDNKYALCMGPQSFNGGPVNCPIADLAQSDLGHNYAGYTGFDTFILGGKRYYATFYQTKEDLTKAFGMMKVGVFDENGTLVKKWDNSAAYSSTAGRGAISAEYVANDENSAYIYVFCQTAKIIPSNEQAVAVAQLKFTAGDSAGLNDIMTDDNNVPAVYYNLQGIEIANPDNGIYLVRRGNKVTKEIVK